MSFATDCEPFDFACGAKAACEMVTGGGVKQDYDCVNGGVGLSFFPEDGPGLDSFSFGAYPSAGAGNICACDASNFEKYGIPRIYEPCAEGGWRFK